MNQTARLSLAERAQSVLAEVREAQRQEDARRRAEYSMKLRQQAAEDFNRGFGEFVTTQDLDWFYAQNDERVVYCPVDGILFSYGGTPVDLRIVRRCEACNERFTPPIDITTAWGSHRALITLAAALNSPHDCREGSAP